MTVKFVISILTLLILCSLNAASKISNNSSEISDDYSDDDFEDNITHKMLILIPIYNISSIEKLSEREKLLADALEEVTKLAAQISKTAPITWVLNGDFYAEEQYSDVEKENTNVSDNTTASKDDAQTELDDEIKLNVPKELVPDWQTLSETTLARVLEASEKYLHSISATQWSSIEEDLSEWLKDIKNTNDILSKLDLLNNFFDIFRDLLDYEEYN